MNYKLRFAACLRFVQLQFNFLVTNLPLLEGLSASFVAPSYPDTKNISMKCRWEGHVSTLELQMKAGSK